LPRAGFSAGRAASLGARARTVLTFRDGGLVRPVTFALAGVVVALSACSATKPLPIIAAPRPTSAQEVVIYDYKFAPLTLTIPVGTTVTWVNHDMAPHTATHRSFGDDAFDSGNLTVSQLFKHRFRKSGTYAYLCILHQGMQGTIVVQ
jgi:plastocyanin